MIEIINKQTTSRRRIEHSMPRYVAIIIAMIGWMGMLYLVNGTTQKTPLQICQESYLERLKTVKEQNKALFEFCTSGTDEIWALRECSASALEIPKNTCWTVAPASTGAPPKSWPKIEDFRNNFECIPRKKTTWLEFHHTAENYPNQKNNQAKLLAIWNAHTSLNGRVQGSGIWYHYVIDDEGTIWRTRNRDCTAIADSGYEKVKNSNENTEHIHIAFIGDDKPNQKQTDSMLWLSQKLINDYGLKRTDISAHSDNAPKNKKESFEYWYWSKIEFWARLRDSKKTRVLRDGVYNEWATYAWNKYKDMDFMLLIDGESGWNSEQVGDWNNPKPWAYSYGYCQFNSTWHMDTIKRYKDASIPERVDICWEKYQAVKPNVGKTFHAWYNRESRRKNLSFEN